jgi:hypothetical protein
LIPNSCLLYANDLEEIKTITFCISIPYYFTGNNMYKTQRVGSKVWVRKADEVTILQRYIEAEIHRLGVKAPSDVYCYACDVAFCSNKSFWITKNGKLKIVDLTNIWKVTEDGLFEGSGTSVLKGLGINDAYAISMSLNKCVLPEQIETPPHYVAVYLTFYKLKGD